ncbi:hypothetical protein Tco_1366747 [Tanacetum coccineum]
MDAAEFEAPPSPNYVSGPEHPPSPDYMPGPEHPPLPDYMLGLEEPKQAPLSLDYVLEPEYPEYLVPSDVKAPIEDHPLPDVASPVALSPGYVTESDPEEDLEEDPDDGGYDDDDESSNDDDDDDEEEEQEAFEDDDEEEEEHPDVADSFAVPVDDPVPSAEVTEAFETDNCYRGTHVAVAAALPSSPPPSPLTLLSSPLPQIPSPSLPKRACFSALASKFEVEESSAAAATRQAGHALTGSVDYGFIDTVDASIHAAEIEREAVIARQACAHSKSRSQAMEAQIRALQRDVDKILPKKRTTRTITTAPMTDAQIKALITQGVADALTEIEANRTSRNGDDSHDSRTSSRRTERAARGCTYSEFLKCQPLKFKGTEGVVSLSQWFEKMESVFHISNCTIACQIKFTTYTLLGSALTWWNSHVKTVGHDATYGMPWKTLKKIMTAKYCPRALMCSRMVPEESDEVKKYVGGLPDMIQGSVMASKQKTMQDAIEFSTKLMDQKIRAIVDRHVKNKRKFDDTSRNNQN